MKQRLFIMVTILLALNSAGKAQMEIYNGKTPIVVAKDEVRNMQVSGNIGVVLRKERGDGLHVGMDKSVSDKVKVTFRNNTIYIVAKDNQPSDERIIVYAWFDDLHTITLNGNVLVNSVGVLNYDNLVVNLDREAKISLKTTGKIKVNAPEDYQFTQRQQYSSIDTGSEK